MFRQLNSRKTFWMHPRSKNRHLIDYLRQETGCTCNRSSRCRLLDRPPPHYMQTEPYLQSKRVRKGRRSLSDSTLTNGRTQLALKISKRSGRHSGTRFTMPPWRFWSCHKKNKTRSSAMIFLRDSLCLSAVSLSRQRHDILDISCCPLSSVLDVTLTNGQGFEFEVHLRSSPSAFSGFVNVSRPANYFTTCYTVLTRPNKVETAVQCCN